MDKIMQHIDERYGFLTDNSSLVKNSCTLFQNKQKTDEVNISVNDIILQNE